MKRIKYLYIIIALPVIAWGVYQLIIGHNIYLLDSPTWTSTFPKYPIGIIFMGVTLIINEFLSIWIQKHKKDKLDWELMLQAITALLITIIAFIIWIWNKVSNIYSVGFPTVFL